MAYALIQLALVRSLQSPNGSGGKPLGPNMNNDLIPMLIPIDIDMNSPVIYIE